MHDATTSQPDRRLDHRLPGGEPTLYRNTDGTGGQTTSYAYTWFSGTIQPESVTTTLPTVTTAQNGPNSANRQSSCRTSAAGRSGRRTPAGSSLHRVTTTRPAGRPRIIETWTPPRPPRSPTCPPGWSTPSGGGLHLTTTYRTRRPGHGDEDDGPERQHHLHVFDDDAHEVRVYRGWDTSTNTPTGPTEVYREDRARGYTETLTMSATPSVTERPAERDGGDQRHPEPEPPVLNDAGQVVYARRITST